MITLPAEALKALEKVLVAEDDFIALFKGLAVGASSVLVTPPAQMLTIHSSILLHIIANLVEAQIGIQQLEGQLAILKTEMEDRSNGNGTDAKGD